MIADGDIDGAAPEMQICGLIWACDARHVREGRAMLVALTSALNMMRCLVMSLAFRFCVVEIS